MAAFHEQIKHGMENGLLESANKKLAQMRAALPRRPYRPPPGRRHHPVMYARKDRRTGKWLA
eukprot:365663-Chlamydomonas_euryale.AAC.18